MTRLLSLALAVTTAGLVACGPPLESREDTAAVLAHSAFPATHAQSTARHLAALASAADTLPQPSVTLVGANGGQATIEFNLVGAVVGLVGEGLLFNVHYSDYSNDGLLRLNGDMAVLANYSYVGNPDNGEDPYADLRLTLAGRAHLSGVVYDDLHARISLTTRFHDLQFHDTDSISMRLDGYVEGENARFDFAEEDVIAAWNRFAEQQ